MRVVSKMTRDKTRGAYEISGFPNLTCDYPPHDSDFLASLSQMRMREMSTAHAQTKRCIECFPCGRDPGQESRLKLVVVLIVTV